MRLDILRKEIPKLQPIQANTNDELTRLILKHDKEGYSPIWQTYTKVLRKPTNAEQKKGVTDATYRYGVYLYPRHIRLLKFKLWYILHKEAVKRLVKKEFELIGFLRRFK